MELSNLHTDQDQIIDHILKTLEITMKDQEQRHRTNQKRSPRDYSDRPRNSRQNSRGPGRSHTPRKNSSKLIGQIFGLIYNLALLYLVYDLAQAGSDKLALGIFALNAALIIFAAIFNKKSSKRRPNSYNNRDSRSRSPRSPRQS